MHDVVFALRDSDGMVIGPWGGRAKLGGEASSKDKLRSVMTGDDLA
jgi:hypothetical protein